MKVLLRDRKTQLYVQREGQWTADRELALDFGQSGHAVSFAVRARIGEAEAVLTFDRPELDLVLSIQVPRRLEPPLRPEEQL